MVRPRPFRATSKSPLPPFKRGLGGCPVPFAQHKGTRSAVNEGDARRGNKPEQKETSPRGDVSPAIRSLGGLTIRIHQLKASFNPIRCHGFPRSHLAQRKSSSIR